MKNLLLVKFFFFSASIIWEAKCSNILVLLGCASHSHHLWNEVVVGPLAERGHSLTVVSVDENKVPKPNVTHIHMERTYPLLDENTAELYDIQEGQLKPPSSGTFTNILFLYKLKMLECKGIFESNGFQDVLRLNQKFDLILYDTETGPCMLRLIERFPNVPVVGMTAYKMDPRVVEILGGHSYPGYVPHILKNHEMPMNFWKRLENSAAYVFSFLYRKLISDRYIDQLARINIPGSKAAVGSLYERIKIVLVNTHPSMDNAKSLPPNIIEVGGLHIKQPKPLPDHMNTFIEGSKKGAVLISLGSNLQASVLGKQRIEALINVIKRFPEYNFLWKVEDKGLLKEYPKNLMIRKWMPQNDILAHPKLKVFFTHAGGLSMQEAVFHGKPLVAMPFYVDQTNNAFLAAEKGYGKVVTFDNLNEETLYSAFSEVFKNASYTKNMLRLQKQFLDRQNEPLDAALWWIEYFLRNPQADHLSPYSRNMSYFIANSLDILLVGYCLISLTLYLVFSLLFKLFNKMSNKAKSCLKIKKLKMNKLKKT